MDLDRYSRHRPGKCGILNSCKVMLAMIIVIIALVVSFIASALMFLMYLYYAMTNDKFEKEEEV